MGRTGRIAVETIFIILIFCDLDFEATNLKFQLGAIGTCTQVETEVEVDCTDHLWVGTEVGVVGLIIYG